MERSVSKTRAKRSFVILYLASLVLIFVVVSAFWKTPSAAPAQTTVEKNDDASHFMQIDTMLHAKMEAMDTSIARYFKTRSSEELTKVQRQVYFLQSAIDSIDKQALILLEGSRRQHMQMAVANFKKLMGERNRVLYGGETLPVQTVSATGTANTNSSGAETEKLKQLLAQKEERVQALEQLNNANGQDKDKLILSLQSQLKQKDAALQQRANVSQQAGTDNEWRQKYASLKTLFDNTAASEKALKAAYKTVAEDNRRLLNQLQTLRTEKKN